ncbi:MAG: ribosomal RNA small subunit methyltransferase A [Acidobacteria bacterium]|nr:ribosomal RNA small subunit methyltransferase A [Acidobacteriota bacterium]
MPQRLGQHFLRDGGWREKILRALDARPGDVWLEIGAGHGEMTRDLARTASRVLAIEVDARLREDLQRLATNAGNIQIVPGDVLQLNLDEVIGPEPVRVYGSLPYYITSPIVRRLFEHAAKIRSIAVVIQLEVAVRITAQPGSRDYGFLSVICQYYSQPEIALRLPPGAFVPRPKVASALVRMRLPGECAKLGVQDEAAFESFLQACFAQKRKTLLNNLKALVPAEKAETAIAAAGLKPQVRAEELSLSEFSAVFRRVT